MHFKHSADIRAEASRLRKDFLKQGFDPSDVTIAVGIYAMIAELDQALFPENTLPIKMRPHAAHCGWTAMHAKPRTGRQHEHYKIFIPNITASWKRDMFVVPTIRNRRLTGEVRRPTLKEFITVTAAHEVRHGLQLHLGRKLKCFTSRSWMKSKNRLLLYIGDLVQRSMIIVRGFMRRDKLSPQQIRSRTKSDEFDAEVIEHVILCKLPHITSISQMVELMKVEPTSKI